MKKRVHKNQIVITTLAVLIAVAGYVTYDKKGADIKDAETVANMNQGAVNGSDSRQYVPSLMSVSYFLYVLICSRICCFSSSDKSAGFNS